MVSVSEFRYGQSDDQSADLYLPPSPARGARPRTTERSLVPWPPICRAGVTRYGTWNTGASVAVGDGRHRFWMLRLGLITCLVW